MTTSSLVGSGAMLHTRITIIIKNTDTTTVMCYLYMRHRNCDVATNRPVYNVSG